MVKRGAGPCQQTRPWRVAGGGARLVAAPSDRAPWHADPAIDRRWVEFRRLGSGALACAETADGLNDGYLELHINAWDVLAGILLVREAGGWTSEFLVGDGLMNGNPVIACTPEIENRMRAAMTGLV